MFSTQLGGKELYVHVPANNLTTMNALKRMVRINNFMINNQISKTDKNIQIT